MAKMLEKFHKELKAMIDPSIWAEIVPVDITPTARWFLEENEQEYYKYRDDFPCVLPPAPVTWIEFEMPTRVRSTEKSIDFYGARHLSALIMMVEIPENHRLDFLKNNGLHTMFVDFLRRGGYRNGTLVVADNQQQGIDNAVEQGLIPRWAMIWQLLAEPLNERKVEPVASYAWYADEQGQLLSDAGYAYMPLSVEQGGTDYFQHCFAASLPFLFALSLTHCRNVEIVESDVPAAVRKKRDKKGIPNFVFKQIVIRPMGKRTVGKDQGEVRPDGSKRNQPLHYVRMHTKTFTEDKPLFGKHVGRFVWHLSRRGDITQGNIVKEYRVEKDQPT